MKNFSILILVLASGIVPLDRGLSEDHEKPAFSISASVAAKVIKAGSPVPVSFKFLNSSDHAVTLTDTDPECDYRITVIDEQGRPIRLTEVGQTIYKSTTCQGTIIRRNLTTLDPGESEEEIIDAARLFDVTEPGKYTVRVERDLSDIKPGCRN